jgi:hypothetical protein
MGKPAMIEGYVSAVPGSSTEYELNISCDKLPLNPIVSHFHPENKVDWGRLTANCYVKGDALAGETFKRTFIARGIDPSQSAFLEIEDAHWGFTEDDPIIGFIAGPLALDLPELLDSHFNGAKLEIVVERGKADFKLGAQGPLVIAAAKGKGEVGQRFLDTKVDQNIEIALPQILAKKFFKLELKDQITFWPLPSGLLRLSGPIRRPKPSVDELVVAQLASQRLTGRPINFLFGIPGALFGKPGNNIEGEQVDPFDLLENQKEQGPFNPLNILRLIPGLD